jgi:lipopolysaccharide export system protein LptA
MKQSHCNPIRAAILLAAIFCFGFPAAAQKDNTPKTIHIQADKLVADNNAGTAEFIGRVKATQDNTEIRANRLKIHYATSGGDDSSPMTGKRTITKVVASGNVTIRMDDNTAHSDSAVYDIKTRVLTLSGPSSKIVSGENFITGAKIRLHRDTGQINVDGDGKKPIEVLLNPGKGGFQ